jgi:hypothetical protein
MYVVSVLAFEGSGFKMSMGFYLEREKAEMEAKRCATAFHDSDVNDKIVKLGDMYLCLKGGVTVGEVQVMEAKPDEAVSDGMTIWAGCEIEGKGVSRGVYAVLSKDAQTGAYWERLHGTMVRDDTVFLVFSRRIGEEVR